MGKDKSKPNRPKDFKKPRNAKRCAWRERRNTSESSSLDAMSPIQTLQSPTGGAMQASSSCSSLDSESSQFSRATRSSRKRSRVEFEEDSRLSLDLESSLDSSVFCSQCKEKESEVARLMDELTIRDSLRSELDEMVAKFKEEEKSKEEALDRLTQEESSCERLKQELEDMRIKYEEENRLKDEALNRLSALASSRLRDNNANIADLSDQNRPTKIAEYLSELYDNEWTDAFDELQSADIDERKAIEFLLKTLMEIFRICKDISTDNFFENIQHSIEFPIQREPPSNIQCVLPDDLKQQIKEFRKSRATHVVQDIVKVVLDTSKSEYDSYENVMAYKRRCAEISWLMVVQNPPLMLSDTAGREFNNNEYKDYTERGAFVDFVVWPSMFLHEDGPLLSKGVAQGCSSLA